MQVCFQNELVSLPEAPGATGGPCTRDRASLSSPQAPHAWQNVCCRHPCPRRRHRRYGKTCAAGIFSLGAGTVGRRKRGLQASLPSPQASQTLQIMYCRHACVCCRHPCLHRRHSKHCKSRVRARPARVGFHTLVNSERGEEWDSGEERRGMSARAAQHCIHDRFPNGNGDVIQSDGCYRYVNRPKRVWWSNTL